MQGRVRSSDDKLARALFRVILSICDQALQAAVEKGSLVALEARTAARHRMLLDEIAAVANNLELLSGKPNIPEILEFERRYRSQVSARHDSISPPHLDRQKKFPIDSLYVAPHLTRYLPRSERWSPPAHELIKTQQLLSIIHRAVILGSPGAGKSTFALKLCHDLSTNGRFASREVTPILVILRDYGAQKKEHNYSILQFIRARSTAWYQVEPPVKAFEYLFLNGRAVVIFDGLDELLETSYRREIGDDIETFSNLYPSTPVLVTSRVVGYEQAPLDPRKFESYRLADFVEQQVKEYSSKWFSTDDGSTQQQQAKRAQAFVNESRSVPDLRSNPLMLALMCNIYLGEDFIPTNRPEVYKKCALMLFERWDRSRRIHTNYGFENQLSPIMTHIAHWLYAKPTLQSGVTEGQLVKECAAYLHPRRYEHPEEAEKAASDFIEFCRGRAWVFSDAGTTPEGDRLYQFTHRTFLEYFTALYLFRTNPRPVDLLGVLRPRIAKREWDVVAQLAFHIASRETEGGGDELLSGLLEAAASKPSEQTNLLTFVGRCMEFVSCSPKVSRKVAEATLASYLSWSSAIVKSGKLLENRPTLFAEGDDLIGNLLHTGLDSRNTVTETLEGGLREYIIGTDEVRAGLAAEIAVTLPIFVHRRRLDVDTPSPELLDHWRPAFNRVLTSCHDRVQALLMKYPFIARAAKAVGLITLTQFAQWHGPKAILKETASGTQSGAWTAIGQAFLYHLIQAPYSHSMAEMAVRDVPELEEIGTILLRNRIPWSSRPDFALFFIDWVYAGPRRSDVQPPSQMPSISSAALFGGFLLAATAVEASERTKQAVTLLKRLSQTEPHFGLLKPLQKTLLGRISPQDLGTIKGEVSAAALTDEQANFVIQWATRKVNFIRHHGKRLR